MRKCRQQRDAVAGGVPNQRRRATPRLVAATVLALCAAPTASRADVVIGNWEDSADGWIDWGTQSAIAEPKYAFSTVGVTAGTKSVQVTQNGFNQGLSIKLQDNGLRDAFVANTQFSIDFSVPANAAAGWAELYTLWINAQNYGFVGQTPVAPKLQYGFPNDSVRTTTLTWDYGALVDGNAANGEIAATAGWIEFILGTNSSDADHGVFYFDNARLSSPFVRVDLNGGGTGTLHPNQAGFTGWDTLPTSGQNGNPAQNGYPTASATNSIATGTVASGAIQTTLTSVDVGGSGTPVYITGATPEDGPKVNARDMSIPGREFDNSGNFTPLKDNIYRDFVFAEAGTATSTTGTNHRMEVKFEGLDPNTPYKVKLYAYDNSNPQGVFVFTDVTAQPLIFMPSGNSTDGVFTPGDGSGNTQYAPDGQYIDGSAAPTFPAGDDFRAIELFATSDGTGKIVFAETTVTGLAGTTQILPILNGFEIQKDQRSWLGTPASTNWNDAGNWSGGAIANNKGQVANFGNTSATSITVDAPTTVARLNFSGSSLNIGGGTLTLDDTSINSTLAGGVVTGRTEINLTGSSAAQTISAPLILKKDTQVWTATAAQKVTLSDLQPAAVTLTKAGEGTLEVNNVRTNALRVNGGTVAVLPNATASGASNVGALSIAPGARLDLTDNKLVTSTPAGTFDGTAYNGVQGEVARAYNFGSWDQPGLMTSEELAGPNAGPLSGTTTIGVATGEQILFLGPTDTGVFLGQTVTGASTIAMYTYAGDMNFDGLVDAADYGVIDNWVQFPGSDGYANGDLNYDGVIDAADYGIIDNTIQLQGAPFPGVNDAIAGAASAGSSGVTPVPEPTACGLALVAAAGLLGRRGRRGRRAASAARSL
jgi:hypothetical protein